MKKLILLVTVLFSVLSLNAFAVTQMMTMQGTVNGTTAGTATFVIYDNITGGTLLYNASTAFANSRFDYVMGNSTRLDLDFGQNYYLDLYIDGTRVTTSRQPFQSAIQSGIIIDSGLPSIYMVNDTANSTATGIFSAAFGSNTNTSGAYSSIIGGRDINVSGDYSFGFGRDVSVINNYRALFFSATYPGILNVIGDIQVNSTSVCLSNGTNCISSGASGVFVGFTALQYNGNLTNGTLIGYEAANKLCNASFLGSYFCTADEIIGTIRTEDISGFSQTGWMAEGAPGYLADANDCNGWTSQNVSHLGSFWEYDSNGGGMGWLVNCGSSKNLSCCR